jgi:protein-arginine kinase activator protein McsA
MNCRQCGQREATIPTIVLSEDVGEYRELCQTCCDLMVAENEAEGWRRARADPEGMVRQMETNLGRPLSADELREVDRHLSRSHI